MTSPVRPVTVSSDIAADADVVFGFISDTRNDALWNPNVSEVHQIVGNEVAVGSKYEFTQTIETKKRTLVSEVTAEIVELGDRSVRWAIDDKYQTRQITMWVEPTDNGCVVNQTTEATFKRDPGFLTRTLYPMLAKRTFRTQFETLKGQFT